MFIVIGDRIYNTDYIIRASRARDSVKITLAEDSGDNAGLGFDQWFKGAEAEAIWRVLTTPNPGAYMVVEALLAGQE